MKGKEKCRALKEIRRQIAEKNDIPYAVSQCTHQGDCKGTCPKCESELRYLERELAIRQGLGKAVTIAGISIGACTTFAACSPTDVAANFSENIRTGNGQTAGSLPVAGNESDEVLDGDILLFEENDGEAVPEPVTGEVLPEDSSEPANSDADDTSSEREDFLAGFLEIPDSEPDETLPEIEGVLPLPSGAEPDEAVSELEGDIAIEP
ncbi:MAG: hypothetical protein NC548_20545 [Lachnospiraceae bacterium]|nr:hypothetical protein [Lachnospiraceae bacterium]